MRGVLVLVLVCAALAPMTGASGEGAVRLMVVGDSISQGSAGDYTWRYFLHRHLVAAGQPVDMVGPRDDLWDAVTDAPGSHAYADPDFDDDHASQWGNALAFPRFAIRDVAAQHAPDVVVLALGTNDLGVMQQTPEATWSRVQEEVAGLQRVNPAVTVVLVEVTSTDLPGAAAYNQLLRTQAPALGTARSQVAVAWAAEGFLPSTPDREGDTWDHVHPDTSGQVRIAAAVADALAGLGVGAPYPRPLHVPPDGLRRAPVLRAVAGDASVLLGWRGPPGATGHDVWLRDASAGLPWGLARQDVRGTAVTIAGLVPGHTYKVRVRARKGYTAAASDMASDTVSVTVPGRTTRVPPRVRGLEAEGRRGRVLLTWRPVPEASAYVVWWRRLGDGGWESRWTRGTRTAVRHLSPGATYVARVQAIGDGLAGRTSRAVRAVVAGVPPARVVRLRVGPGRGEVVARWREVRGADRYEVQHLRLGPRGRWRSLPVGLVLSCDRVPLPGLAPGRHLVRVRAWSGELAGGWSLWAPVHVGRA